MSQQPQIVCLCGSTRFFDEFTEANYRLTLEGNIVLSVGFFHHSRTHVHGEASHGEVVGITPEQKLELDQLHLHKIDLCNWVYVINPNGYIGASTKREIWYAMMKFKIIRFLEEDHRPTSDEVLSWFKDRHAWEAAAQSASK